MGNNREEQLLDLVIRVRSLTTDFEALSNAASQHTGLNRTDMRALELIARREGLTAGELASSLRLTTGAITGVIDRLEKAGHAVREVDLEDRRRVVVQSTKDARLTGQRLFFALQQSIRDSVAGYSEEELRVVSDFLGRIHEAISNHARELTKD